MEMLEQEVLNDELASLINQGRMIVDQFKERAVTLGEARQFLNELRESDEYLALSKASVEKLAIDAKLQTLSEELKQLALENRRSI